MPLTRSTRRSTTPRSAGSRSSPVAKAVLAAKAGGIAGWSEALTETRIIGRAGMAMAKGRNGCELAFKQANVRAIEYSQKPLVSDGFSSSFYLFRPSLPVGKTAVPLLDIGGTLCYMTG